MNINHFYFFNYDLGFKYKGTRSTNEIEAAFQELIKIKEFDGAKNIDQRKGSVRVRLTSADNQLRLSLSQDDLSIVAINANLEPKSRDRFEKVNALQLQVHDVLGSKPIESVRSRQIVFSVAKSDRDHLLEETVNPKHLVHLDDLDISFYFAEEDIAGKPVESYVSIANQHTQEMHRVLEKLGKKSYLEKLIAIYSSVGFLEDPKLDQVKTFLANTVEYHYSLRVLESFGYGEE